MAPFNAIWASLPMPGGELAAVAEFVIPCPQLLSDLPGPSVAANALNSVSGVDPVPAVEVAAAVLPQCRPPILEKPVMSPGSAAAPVAAEPAAAVAAGPVAVVVAAVAPVPATPAEAAVAVAATAPGPTWTPSSICCRK